MHTAEHLSADLVLDFVVELYVRNAMVLNVFKLCVIMAEQGIPTGAS